MHIIIFRIMLFSIMSCRSVHSVLVGLVCLAIVSCSSSVGSSNNTILCLESERHALLQFKQGLVDESNALASWESKRDCCEWRGIACNNHTGHVITLDLSSSYLRGEIHHSLLELQNLNYLDLSYNDFRGMIIPVFIGSLSQLKELKLARANFSGHVPPHLGNLSNLHTLDLWWNKNVRSENLEWLSHLYSLRYLNMSGVDLSEVVNWPKSLSNLTSLRELHLCWCDLPDVNLSSFSFINSSTSLQFLDLSMNNLNSSIIHWIANVSTNFVYVDLFQNNLEGPIPDAFTSMLSLVTLDLSYNQLEGGIPKGFQNLCNLKSLLFGGNQLSGNIEDSMKTLSCSENTLETLFLGQNLFWGSLPDLKRFSELSRLDLSSNQLNGSLPESVGQLSCLEALSLSNNSFTGVITESHFQNLSRLHNLSLYGNRVSFNLSSNWNPPFQLTFLDMSDRKVGPAFPKWILTQSNLTWLLLSNAGISGSLPDKFWDLFPRLIVLDLSNNQIRGELPELSTTSLTRVTLSFNLFSGPVPTLFSPMLEYLDLSNNTFSELLPSFCASRAPYLGMIDLSENLLSGELPDCWMQFPDLEVLDFRNNKLSGKIPSSLGGLKSITFLRFNYNNFSGEFPSLENCTQLLLIDLGNNNLSGNMPTWIGQSLTDLVILRLRSNAFDGIIPFSFCNLAAIHVLDLSHNNISGGLPYCIGNISSLANATKGYAYSIAELMWKGTRVGFGINLQDVRFIDISRNSLVGEIPQSIASMAELKYLNLSRNNLMGKLPENFDNLKMLESLDLSRNKISGELPELSTTSLIHVILSFNLFSGAVPTFFSPMLVYLDLSNNTFSELLPSFCASRAPYFMIDLSKNLLSGELPDCWMQFPSLEVLHLGNNKLSGKIPSSLGGLKSMIFLRLNDNNFSGEFPSLENCTQLLLIDLGNNNLSGNMPTWIGQSLTDLVILRLRSNAFDGIIPFSFCNLAAIHVLDLSHNNISGGLPHCLNNITALAVDDIAYSRMDVELVWKGIEREFGKNLREMRSIDISSNSLVAEIPESITKMKKLKSLNFAGNNLTGKLPENFGNMKMLESLDLSRNKISGEIPTSFASLNFLSFLNLSHNKLSGSIPTGTQLQSFKDSAYIDNLGLCGPPLTPNCSGNGTTQADDKELDTKGLISLGFFISAVLGFVTGFWIVCGSLLLKSSWRYAYFKFLDDSRDWIYVRTAVNFKL